MKKLLVRILIMFLTVSTSISAQTAQQSRKPSPEFQKEGEYYVGDWMLTGETKPSPFGPGGQKFDASERLEWMPGGFFLMARSYEGAKWSALTIIGYDKNKRVFTHTRYTETGEIETMEGTVHGETEIWSGNGELRGKLTKQRLIIERRSPTLYTFKGEIAADSGNWSVVYEGQAIKTTARPLQSPSPTPK
jgi:hypothetical protein